MGTMKFLLPSGLPEDAARELERSSVAGGQDSMPFPTKVNVAPDQMTLARTVDESGCLLAPWEVGGSGRLMSSSATLMERTQPYDLLVELTRGKTNQVRCQLADWIMGGLEVNEPLAGQVRQATKAFVHAALQAAAPGMDRALLEALSESYKAADLLTQTYISQVFALRHQRQERLDTSLGCRLASAVPDEEAGKALTESFNTWCLPFFWDEIEPAEGEYHWDGPDALVDWALSKGMRLHGGPLIDFSAAHLPDWLWHNQPDLADACGWLCAFVETIVRRYRGSIRTWYVSAASNAAGINPGARGSSAAAKVLDRGDEELLWLTVRLVEAARQVDPTLEVIVGVSQPWGEYLVDKERTHSPFLFADTLLRSGLSLWALDLEIVMGVWPRGSYCRDLLDASKLVDLYGLFGVPLQVTLGYPSGGEGRGARGERGAGFWRSGFSPDMQADWASAFAGLALCKPSVRSVQWAEADDRRPQLFPDCGLFGSAGEAKAALQSLRDLRALHLK
jgi:hypothetical protein